MHPVLSDLCMCGPECVSSGCTYVADPDCFTLKLLLLPSGSRLLRVTQPYTQLINFIVLLHLRDGLPSDIPDNCKHHLLPLPAV